MNTKNVVMTALLLSLGLAISAQAQAPIPGEANLLVWLKADDGVQNSGNTGPCVVGSPTGNWLDKSGNGNNAEVVLGTMELAAPSFGDPCTPQNVVRFNGDGCYKLVPPDPNALLKSDITAYFVIRTMYPVDPWRSALVSSVSYISIPQQGDVVKGFTADSYYDGKLEAYTACGGPGNNDWFAMDKVPGGYHILTFCYNLSQERKSINFDGGLLDWGKMACLSYWPHTPDTSGHEETVYYIGGHLGAGNLAQTDMAEFILWDDCSRATSVRIEKYLSEKYSIPLADKECGDHGYYDHDTDKDCYITLQDFATMAVKWLECTDPDDPSCGVAD